MNWKHTGDFTAGKNGEWKYSTFEVSVDLEKYGIRVVDNDEDMAENENAYPASVLYEFFNEEGDLFPNQEDYAKLLSFTIGRGMRNKIHSCTQSELRTYQSYGKRDYEKIRAKFNSHNAGRYELVDFYIDFEIKGSYAILYFQYKIKPVAQ